MSRCAPLVVWPRPAGTPAVRRKWRAWLRPAAAALVLIVCAQGSAGERSDAASADLTPAAAALEPWSTESLAFRVAKVVALDDQRTVLNDAVVLVKDGRIEKMGPASEVAIPPGYRTLEFREHWLLPGIVEAHNHSAAGGMADLNDMIYQTNPGLDTRSIPQPDNYYAKRARAGGVTTCLVLPGSGTNISGMGTIVSTAGRNPDEMILRSPGSLKVAQSGNPEWYFGGNGRTFMNWNTRQTIEKARAYSRKWDAWEAARETDPHAAPPEFDPIWELLRPVFRHEIPVTNHTQMYQVLNETLDMFVRGFKLWTVTEHSSFDAWKVGPVVKQIEDLGVDGENGGAKGGLWTIQGPRQYHYDRTCNRIVGNASGWWKHGVRNLGINTDAPVIPQEQLTYQAAMACWYGWLPYPALLSITNVTAKSIGVYDRVGSLAPAKQADLTIWTGDPLDPRSACLMTVVKGRIVYDGTKGMRRF
ncbi:MAG: amidohydrolase family protein [Planctomycetota bacterium]